MWPFLTSSQKAQEISEKFFRLDRLRLSKICFSEQFHAIGNALLPGDAFEYCTTQSMKPASILSEEEQTLVIIELCFQDRKQIKMFCKL